MLLVIVILEDPLIRLVSLVAYIFPEYGHTVLLSGSLSNYRVASLLFMNETNE